MNAHTNSNQDIHSKIIQRTEQQRLLNACPVRNKFESMSRPQKDCYIEKNNLINIHCEPMDKQSNF